MPDTTNRGVNDIVIDYSNDGQNWTEVTEFTVPEAPGSAFYQGDEGPDFDGIVARYVLISVLNSHGDPNCVGMSELRINATIATSTNVPDGELDLVVEANPNPATEFTIINIRGVKHTGKTQIALVVGLLSLLVFYIVVGFFFIKPSV